MIKDEFSIPMNEDEEVDRVKEYIEKGTTHNVKLSLLNLVIVLRREAGKATDELKKLRTSLAAKGLKENIKIMNEKGASLPSKDEVASQMNMLFARQKYKAFIINYLMFHYGVRNLDLDLVIVKGRSRLPAEGNYIKFISSKGQVTYVRRAYKTVKTYGEQTHVITDKKFIASLKALEAGPLLSGTQIHNDIGRNSILNEGDMFKMLVDAAYKKEDTAEINRLSESRGTAITTIKSNYNVNATPEIISKL
tara:strand:- start:132 stop:881 length:750 start_codon:yes stop_codon:yes gene_type:complete